MKLQMDITALNVNFGSFKNDETKDVIEYASVNTLEDSETTESFAGRKVGNMSIEGNDKESAHQIAARIHAYIAQHGAPCQLTVSGGSKLKTDQRTKKSVVVITINGFEMPTDAKKAS